MLMHVCHDTDTQMIYPTSSLRHALRFKGTFYRVVFNKSVYSKYLGCKEQTFEFFQLEIDPIFSGYVYRCQSDSPFPSCLMKCIWWTQNQHCYISFAGWNPYWIYVCTCKMQFAGKWLESFLTIWEFSVTTHWRYDVTITSKRRHFDVITSKWLALT